MNEEPDQFSLLIGKLSAEVTFAVSPRSSSPRISRSRPGPATPTER